MYSLYKYFILASLCLLLSIGVMGQSTTVNGQVIDTGAQQWKNGTFSFTFVPLHDIPDFSRYKWTGGALPSFINGNLDATGSYSVSVPSSTAITPTGSQWKLQVCSGTTPTNCFTQVQSITGGTQAVNSTPPPVVIPPGSGNSAYADVEVQPAILGSLYFNLTLLAYRNCIATNVSGCATWATMGGSGGGPSSGVATAVQTADGVGGFLPGGARDSGTVFNTNTDDLQSCGPNPNIDIRCFGATTNSGTATGTISSGSTTLTLVSNPDFANGHGLVIPLAGPNTTLATPPTPTVTPAWLLNGVTTYNYRIIGEDRKGGLTAASGTGTTTVGAASLGINTVTLTGCVITDGTTGVIGSAVATFTSSGNHNFQVGAQVDVEGFTGGVFDPCNGVVTVATTPTGTTFTAYKGVIGGETNNTGSPTAKVEACNELTFSAGSVTTFPLRYWLYRNNVLVAVIIGADPHFLDCGLTVTGVPVYIPSSPPGFAQPGFLSTTITSGGATTSLTLAVAASNTATSQTVLHDNVPAMRQAMQAAFNNIGGTIYIPSPGQYLFNSTFDMNAGFTSTFTRSIRIWINNDFSLFNQPWILRSNIDIEGEPHDSTSFSYVNGSNVTGAAHPIFYASETDSTAIIHLKRLRLIPGNVMQTAFMTDEGGDGGSVTGITFDDVNVTGANGNSKPLIVRGGFDFNWNRGVCDPSGSGLKPNYCLTFSRSSTAVTSPSQGQVIGRVKMEKVYFIQTGMEFDCRGGTAPFASVYIFKDTLFESAYMNFIKATGCTGGLLNNVLLQNLDIADQTSGTATPVIDASLGGLGYVNVQSGSGAGGPIYLGVPSTSILNNQALFNLFGGLSNNSGNLDFTTRVQGISGFGISGSQISGRSVYTLPTLAAPVLTPSAGGSVAVGTHAYTVVAVDADGIETTISPATNITIVGGTQTVRLTAPTLPQGAQGWRYLRDGARGSMTPAVCGAVLAPGVDYVDSSGGTCGNSAANINYAGQTILGPNGLSTPGLRFVTNNTPSPVLVRLAHFPATLTPALVAANTCASQSFTVTGLLSTDVLIGVSKPTEQAGLSSTPGHVTGANTATVNFCNNTGAGITPTASEVYNFSVIQ